VIDEARITRAVACIAALEDQQTLSTLVGALTPA
jgi:hypothetical protein